jgi:hypothetical protein
MTLVFVPPISASIARTRDFRFIPQAKMPAISIDPSSSRSAVSMRVARTDSIGTVYSQAASRSSNPSPRNARKPEGFDASFTASAALVLSGNALAEGALNRTRPSCANTRT